MQGSHYQRRIKTGSDTMKHCILPAMLAGSIVFMSSCSNEAWYSGTRASHDISCLKESSADYKTCTEENQLDYDEYQKAKKQIDNDEK